MRLNTYKEKTFMDGKKRAGAKTLFSSVCSMGETVTEILHFSGGNKRTFSGIRTNTIKQGEFTKMFDVDGRMIMVNTSNVDLIEIIQE